MTGGFPPLPVKGGYLERLPLACVASGLAETAEVWSFCGSDDAHFDSRASLEEGAPPGTPSDALVRRVFRADPHPAPYGSSDMAAHIAVHGAPEIMCVWGLGVTKALLDLCRDSILIYNSIDAPAIRIVPELSSCFDIFLTGAEWQSDEIRRRHPDALCAVLPIGPEFASDETFFPTGAAKEYDAVYVAATQPYKRDDLLLDALEALGPQARALCVVGYGDMTDELSRRACARGLNIDWTGPVSHDEVNALINRARMGLVCGRDDGAPAILTEYMLAGFRFWPMTAWSAACSTSGLIPVLRRPKQALGMRWRGCWRTAGTFHLGRSFRGNGHGNIPFFAFPTSSMKPVHDAP